MQTEDAIIHSGTQTTVRSLGALERWYWLMEQYRPSNSSRALWIIGKRDQRMWKHALSELQIRHALLNVSIAEQEPGRPPCFVRSEGQTIPLTIKERVSSEQWRVEMAEQYATPFVTTSAPLIRVVILEGADSCDLIVTFHHSIADGVSCLQLLQDLLRAVDGEVLEQLDVPASLDHLLAQSAQERRSLTSASVREAATSSHGHATLRIHDHTPPTISHLRLSRDHTTSLLHRARQEECSVHAAISAALVLAGQQVSFDWKKGPVRVLSPISLHQLLHIEYDCVVGVTGGIVSCAAIPELELWPLARMFKQDLKPFQNLGAATASNSRLRFLMMQNPDALTVAHTYASFCGYELMISNTGVNPFHDSGELAVKALWGPAVLNGLEGEQSVGIATVGGRIHMLHTSYAPLEGLLDLSAAILIRNSEEPQTLTADAFPQRG